MSNILTSVRFALILGGGLTLYGIFYRLAGLDRVPALAWIFYVMVPVVVALSLRSIRAAAGGDLPFGRGVGMGSLVSAGGSLIYGLYVYFYNRFVDDSLLLTIRQGARRRYEARGLTGSELDRVMAAVETSTQPWIFSLQVFVMLTLVGVVASLVVTAILRRRTVTSDPAGVAAQAGGTLR